MASLNLACSCPSDNERCWNVAWCNRLNVLTSCGSAKSVNLWQYKSGNLELLDSRSDCHSKTVRQTAWSPCGSFVAQCSFDGTISIWQLIEVDNSLSIKLLTSLEGHENEVKSVAWSPSGSFLASCGRDKTVWIWEFDSDEPDYFQCCGVRSDHSQDVKRVVWHPSQDLLVSCSYDNTIKFYCEQDEDWCCVGTLAGHESTVWAAAFNATGDMLASCSSDSTIRLWSRASSNSSSKFDWKTVCCKSGCHEREIFELTWSSVTNLIATAAADDSISVFYPTQTSATVWSLLLLCRLSSAHQTDVNSVAWHPSAAGLLASCGDDGFVKVWQLVVTVPDDDGRDHGHDHDHLRQEADGAGSGLVVADDSLHRQRISQFLATITS